ncbi:hypothetical protein BcDW1_10345 [Botrytis cinerea BcDW1]|uniref:2EXR domain-containing protein n=1 Tax=Botryotinia fuckeliana (strain BcDW1) TaxID=1290391 RepID=M7TIQ8_BOTF1|nr:hypothetical protein BcDW1_10345 [Botrytis cinerea BcDW1]
MIISTQSKLQDRKITPPGYLMASLVEGRGGIGSGMAATAVLDRQALTDNDIKSGATQNKFETKYTAVTPTNLVNSNSGYNTDNDRTPSGQEKVEAAWYSPEMFNFFEIQIYRNHPLSAIDSTVPADSFISFTLLPIELQRKTWFYALPPPDSNIWAQVKVEYYNHDSRPRIWIDHDYSPFGSTALPFPYALQSVCRTAREMFLEHYSQLKFDGINKKISDPGDDEYRKVTLITNPGIWLDREADTLHLTNIYELPGYKENGKVSLNLTGLKFLTIDVMNITWMGEIMGDSDLFWTALEGFCPGLQRLTVVINDIHEFPRVHSFDEISSQHLFQDFNEEFNDRLRHCQWIEPRTDRTSLGFVIQRNRDLCEIDFPKAMQLNMDYWRKIDIRPVWIACITPFYVDNLSGEVFPGPFVVVRTSYDLEVFIPCNEDGSFLDEYDHIKELFDEGDQEEFLIVIDND